MLCANRPLSAAEREPAVPCPDVAPWVSAAKASVGKTGSEDADRGSEKV